MLDPDAFRHTLGALAKGVAVVTVADARGRAMGMTATSVASLSLEPPLLLACIDRTAAIHDDIVRAEVFGVQFLAAGQADIAVRFATRGNHWFDPGQVLSPAGLPCIAGAVASVDCRRAGVLPGGDHAIVTGLLEWSQVQPGAPLIYYRGRYEELAP